MFTSEGKFLMLALDHRESIKKLMKPGDPGSVSNEAIIDLKAAIIQSVIDQASGVLVDPQWGLKAYHNRTKPFLLPVEKSGYIKQNWERITKLQYSVQELIDLGASGAKLLLYFNPNVSSRETQLATARKVLDDCKRLNIPFFLEIITYEPQGEGERSSLVLGSLENLLAAGVYPDVYKLEYAGNFERCREVTKLIGDTPWILLTRGDTFEVFKSNLEQAVRAGAKGFLAGRALWQEVCGLEGEERQSFLKTVLPERFRTIGDIVK